MPDDRPSLFSGLRAEAKALRSEVSQMIFARWELARIELSDALRQSSTFVVVASLLAAVVIVGLGLGLLPVVEYAALRLGVRRKLALGLVGAGLVIVGLAAVWLAWRRFRRRFRGLEDTLAELREDLLWIQEWQADTQAEEDSGE